MSPEELASHLPEWVIPEGTDLAQLRSATEQLIAEFSRPVRLVHQPASQSSSWSYTSEGNRDNAKWFYPHYDTPRIWLCSTAMRLRDELTFIRVMLATVPYASWVCEDSLLHNVFSASEIQKLGVGARRAFRLEWLKQLMGKIDERN